MKILMIPEYSITGGGTLTFFLNFLDINDRLGNKIVLLIQENQKSEIINKYLNKYSIEVSEIPERKPIFFKPYFSVLFELWIWFFYIRKIKYDLLFVSNGTPWLNMGYILVVKKMLYFMHTYPTKLFGWKVSLMNSLSKFVTNNKCVVTVSEYSANQISKYMDIKKENIHVIYNSYNKQLGNLKRKIEKPVVLTIGHVVDYKNPELWLKIAEKVTIELPNVRFLWIGDGDMINLMQKKVKDLGLVKNIQFVGYSINVAEYYSKASVYFQPSLRESHGIAVVEAMSAGIPCVISRVGGMIESVSDRINGFICDVDDIELFSRRIVELLMNKHIANEYGNAGKKIANEKFHESIQESKLMNLFNRIIQ